MPHETDGCRQKSRIDLINGSRQNDQWEYLLNCPNTWTMTNPAYFDQSITLQHKDCRDLYSAVFSSMPTLEVFG